MGPDGKAIAEAMVELRATPAPAAEQIRKGEFLKKGPNATSVETDAQEISWSTFLRALTISTCIHHNAGLWTVLGGLVVQKPC